MEKKYVIGLDIGTSGTRAVLFDNDMNIIYSSTETYDLSQPKNGWAEQNPEDWAKASLDTIKDLVDNSGVKSDDIKGIGLSGQMHGLVMLDDENRVIRPAIIWADQRTEKECEEITNKVGGKRLIEITANPATTGFTASKILWVKNNEPENYDRCRHILLPKDYIRFILTGEYATDVSDASGMQLLDVPKRDWSDEVLSALDIDKKLLGKVYESVDITGRVTESISKLTGLSTDTVVVGGAGDNAAAAIGTGVVEDGSAFTTIGTSGVVFAHTDEIRIDPKGRVHTFCAAVPGTWHVMGVTQAAGLSLRWYRDNIYNDREDDSYDTINKNIDSIEIGSEKLIYLPYLMGERTPHLDPNARGVFFGLSGKHTNKHIGRAVMEGITFSLKDCYDILMEMDIEVDEMVMTGGGAKSPVWRKMLADNYNCDICTITSEEGAALGAGILAAVAVGFYEDIPSACKTSVIKENKIKPDLERNIEYNKYHKIYKKLYKDLEESYKILGEI